jgi:SAM-dependent methyltransferase
MTLINQVRRLGRRLGVGSATTVAIGEPAMIARGWNDYAKSWHSRKFSVTAGHHVQHLGDEWTAEDDSGGAPTYGLPAAAVDRFDEYIGKRLLDAYLPAQASAGLEIGPGGGRLTKLLLERTEVLHAADASAAMLAHLRERLGRTSRLRTHHIDGATLPALPGGSLDFVFAFDVFVHFEPRLVYWYLRQAVPLLKDGGVGIIHYSNTLTPIGWRHFLKDLEINVQGRRHFAAFGVMCPALMERFLASLDVEVVALDLAVIPRDAVTVFRKATSTSPR